MCAWVRFALEINLFGLGQRAIGHAGDVVLEDLRLEGDVAQQVVLGHKAGRHGVGGGRRGDGRQHKVGLRVVRLLLRPIQYIGKVSTCSRSINACRSMMI